MTHRIDVALAIEDQIWQNIADVVIKIDCAASAVVPKADAASATSSHAHHEDANCPMYLQHPSEHGGHGR